MQETKTVHEGRNVKRIREILGIKQEALALDLGISQQAISALEQKEALDKDMLEKVAGALKVSPEAIKNYNDEATISIISNTFHDFKDNAIASAMNYHCSFNPLDKIVELYERLLQLEREKIELLKKN
ncbi:MAG: helix-turn-helix domain-containing protein [Flavisolibacter sp.]